MKKILVLSYSQSGQLDRILDNFLRPFNEFDLDRVKITMKKEFEFPWSSDVFYNTMPETVLEEEREINAFETKYQVYDLIIFAHAPWFLSPSIPCVSMMKNEKIKSLLKDTAIVTIIGSRNMWLNAQESVKGYIIEAGGKLVGNVVLYDKNTNLVSAITILYWMQSGKKDRLYGIFPKPGISDKDIEGTGRFSIPIINALEKDDFSKLQIEIFDLGLIKISTNIMFIELRAKMIFKLWAKKIKSKEDNSKSRKRWVGFFKYYLMFALFLVSPILLVVYNIFVLPFTYKRVRLKKMYFYSLK
jgi:hypothetical protein